MQCYECKLKTMNDNHFVTKVTVKECGNNVEEIPRNVQEEKIPFSVITMPLLRVDVSTATIYLSKLCN